MYSYISKMRHATIRIRTEEPGFSALYEYSNTRYWSIYGNVKGEIPIDTPKPLEELLTTTHYVDANLFHDIMIG